MTPADEQMLTMAKAFAAYPAQYRTRFGEPIGTDPTAPARGRSRLLRMRCSGRKPRSQRGRKVSTRANRYYLFGRPLTRAVRDALFC